MAIWKDQQPAPKDAVLTVPEPLIKREVEPRPEISPSYNSPRRPVSTSAKESLIAEELTIEGKIEGAGHVRIAGRFKGDVHVQGDLSIEPGATVTGGVRANSITIGGQLEGNIDSATRVELLATGVLNGDLSADALIVAAGSRMRGKVEFGWDNKAMRASGTSQKGSLGSVKAESGSAA